MSMNALRYISHIRTQSPLDKLVLYVLADAHNDDTGRCNLSISSIAASTSMPSSQVQAALSRLTRGGTLQRHKTNFIFVGLDDAPVPLPSTWKPSQETLTALLERFPLHNFDPMEFAHDFINYTARENINIRPLDRDSAFLRNASSILEHRQSGPSPIIVGSPRNERTSIRSILLGMR